MLVSGKAQKSMIHQEVRVVVLAIAVNSPDRHEESSGQVDPHPPGFSALVNRVSKLSGDKGAWRKG